MGKKIVLIDGHSILNRAFFGLPDLTNSQGLHTNGVYGFLKIMFRILDEEKPEYLTVAFDRSEPTFRHKMYAEYKGTRKPMAEELRQQVPVLKEVLHAMGIVTVEKAGYEADDILGTLSRRMEAAGMEVRIISGDRDLLQLATDHTMIRIPKTRRGSTQVENYLADDVREKYQVTPTEFIDVKALMGDSSDNIPGVPGIGEKTATALIVKFGSIENAHAHLEEVTPKRARTNLEEHYDMAQMSKELAIIDTAVPIDYDPQQAALHDIHDLFTQEAYPLFKKLEFKNMLSMFEGDLSENDTEKNFVTITGKKEALQFLQSLDREETAIVFYENEGWRDHCESDGQQVLACASPREAMEPLFAASFSDRKGHTGCILTGAISSQELIDEAQHLADETRHLIAMDLKSLMHFLHISDISRCTDISIAAYLINPLQNSYDYDDIARDFLDEMIPAREDLFGRLKPERAKEKDPDSYIRMTCYEAYTAAMSADRLMDELQKENMTDLYRNIEMPLVQTLSDMEKAGVRVDGEALRAYGGQLQTEIDRLTEEIYTLAGEEFNINSPKQLGTILFEKLKMPHAKKTKTGYSTAAGVLEKLAPDYPIVSEILSYRQLTKLKSTYADGLQEYIASDGRIHSTFNQTITATGRISSTDPNLQNIPIRMELGRLIRKVFIPEDGFVLVDADYSQIELRVLAHMSDDSNLIDAYRQEKDIHRITASRVFHVPFDEVTPLQRRNAKAVNFGIVYGISSFGLSQDLSISRKEAEKYIDDYFKTYPDVKKFLDREVESAREKGYSETMFGRRRPVPELKSGNYMKRQFGERVAMNAPIQGSAADIIKIAMIRVHDRLKAEQMKSRLILQVHDELLVEAAEDEIEEVKRILSEEMQQAVSLRVNLEIDMKSGKNWLEAH